MNIGYLVTFIIFSKLKYKFNCLNTNKFTPKKNFNESQLKNWTTYPKNYRFYC